MHCIFCMTGAKDDKYLLTFSMIEKTHKKDNKKNENSPSTTTHN